MLEPLFGSKSRLSVLRVLSLHPEGVYLRQAARLAGVAPILAKRELDMLVRAGILESRKEGCQRFFYPAAENPFSAQLLALVKKDAVPGLLQEALRKVSRIKTCFVYGSVAKGTDSARSDIDVMLIGTPPAETLAKAFSEAERLLGRQVSFSAFSEKEFAGRLAEGNAFISRVMAEPKLMVVGEDDWSGRLAAAGAHNPVRRDKPGNRKLH